MAYLILQNKSGRLFPKKGAPTMKSYQEISLYIKGETKKHVLKLKIILQYMKQ